jgi:2-phospho-L-lactate guanylyltransferase
MNHDAGWHILVPVRGTADSKTRLLPDNGQGPWRRTLALAFACDAVTAALAAAAVAEVSVITADREAGSLFAGLGAQVLLETGGSGLNTAIRQGLRHIDDAHPFRYRAVLMSDVPALAAPDLDAALGLAAGYRTAVVPDAAGTGTVLLTAAPGVDPEPCFGAGSHARHRAAGMATLTLGPASTLRRDVDTPADLEAALALGVGRYTHEALRAAGLRPAA